MERYFRPRGSRPTRCWQHSQIKQNPGASQAAPSRHYRCPWFALLPKMITHGNIYIFPGAVARLPFDTSSSPVRRALEQEINYPRYWSATRVYPVDGSGALRLGQIVYCALEHAIEVLAGCDEWHDEQAPLRGRIGGFGGEGWECSMLVRSVRWTGECLQLSFHFFVLLSLFLTLSIRVWTRSFESSPLDGSAGCQLAWHCQKTAGDSSAELQEEALLCRFGQCRAKFEVEANN